VRKPGLVLTWASRSYLMPVHDRVAARFDFNQPVFLPGLFELKS
jgi:hypothetical protein